MSGADNNKNDVVCCNQTFVFPVTLARLLLAFLLLLSIAADDDAVLSSSSSSRSVRSRRASAAVENDVYKVERSNSKSKSESTEEVVLVVHTFYSRVDTQYDAENENHDALLANWESAWREMGWEPRVLTMEDAKRHPDYEDFNRALDRLPLDGASGSVGAYNRACYLRWLAMGTVGGGWFADFDTVPLRRPTEKDLQDATTGRFNVYHRFHVPALVSGSRDEWNRMATLLIESGLDHVNHHRRNDDEEEILLWSDMNALQYVVENDLCECNVYNKVAEGRFFLNGKPIEPGECWMYRKDIAAHFSHDAMRFGVLGKGNSISNRDKIMKHWFDMYKEKCGIQR